MIVNTDVLISMTEANQNFSKVVRQVDRDGMAVILKNNKPSYVVVDFEEYNTIAAALQMRRERIHAAADAVMEEYREAFEELAK